MLFFAGTLVRARRDGLRQYGSFARRYTRLFHQRWIVEANDERLLGAPDISGLADLGTSYERLERMRLVPFGPRAAILVFVATSAPMVPLLAMQKPIGEVLVSVGRALLGGLPP